MDETTQGVEEVEQSVQTDETTQVEAPTTEETTEANVETETDVLPEDEQKRREAYIKQRQEIKALREQLGYQELEKTFSQPVDQNTDIDTFLRRQEMAEKASLQAMQEISRLKIEREDQELYRDFPQLNPDSKDFDPALDARVAEKYYFLNNVRGENLTPLQVAQIINEESNGLVSKVKEETIQETKERINRRELATGEVTNNTVAKNPSSQESLEALRDRVRRGDMDAKIEYDKIIFG